MLFQLLLQRFLLTLVQIVDVLAFLQQFALVLCDYANGVVETVEETAWWTGFLLLWFVALGEGLGSASGSYSVRLSWFGVGADVVHAVGVGGGGGLGLGLVLALWGGVLALWLVLALLGRWLSLVGSLGLVLALLGR